MNDRDQLQYAIKRGLRMARDPQNAGIDDLHTPRITTIDSWWYGQTCVVCHHSFRDGDHVLPHLTRPGCMVHEDSAAGLWCASRLAGLPVPSVPSDSGNTALRAVFLDALHQHWHPDANLHCLTVERGSPFIGRKCPICRHTVRPGDIVVPCPCGWDCGGVFHQDITRHLTCWDTWSRGRDRAYCPFTGAPMRTTEPQHG
jgi:hypothetical protein